MKIGMMADYYSTHVSGVTNHISLIKHSLENAGHEVYIFTFGDDEVVDEEKNIIRTAGVPVVDTGIYFNLRYNKHARQLLYSMDIAHVHHPFVSGSLAMRYCVPRNIPVVFTNHTRYDLYTQAYLPLLPETIGEAALNAYLSPFFRACDLVIIPSNSIYQVLVDHFGLDLPFAIIPNGIELDLFCKNVKPVDRQIFGFSKDDIIAIYVGRLAPEKNLLFLLSAFQSVAMSDFHLRLLLVGDGPERKNLETLVKQMGMESRVFFTGTIPFNVIPQYLVASDIFTTPSITEVLPLSIIEAIAAGLPVVGMNAPGTRDIIEDGISGLLSSVDEQSFTANLILLATNNDLRLRMGKQALEASKKYDIRTTTTTMLDHYQRLVINAKAKKKGPRYKLTRFMDRFK